jgi:phosphoglycolate phosphatase
MNYKAVIFDLDGTLLDTIEDLSNSMNLVLSRAGFPVHDTDAYKYFIGNGLINLVRRSLPEENRNEDMVSRLLFEMKSEYDNNWDKKSHLYEGISELLNELLDKNIKISVLSNKADKFTKKIISKFFSTWKFEVVIGEREGVPRKPDPTSAFEISQMLNIPPSDFLYLGDSGVDMITANCAGMFAVGALWGFRTEKELVENGAKALIKNPLDLLNLL